jgi:hypothetical protein
MHDPLATYLHDHLAGSHFAIELLDSIEKQYLVTNWASSRARWALT